MCRHNILKSLAKKDKRLSKGLNVLTSEQVYGSNSHLKRVEVAVLAYDEIRTVLKPHVNNQYLGKKLVEYAIAHALWHAANKNPDRLNESLETIGIKLPDGFVPSIDNIVEQFRPKKGKELAFAT